MKKRHPFPPFLPSPIPLLLSTLLSPHYSFHPGSKLSARYVNPEGVAMPRNTEIVPSNILPSKENVYSGSAQYAFNSSNGKGEGKGRECRLIRATSQSYHLLPNNDGMKLNLLRPPQFNPRPSNVAGQQQVTPYPMNGTYSFCNA